MNSTRMEKVRSLRNWWNCISNCLCCFNRQARYSFINRESARKDSTHKKDLKLFVGWDWRCLSKSGRDWLDRCQPALKVSKPLDRVPLNGREERQRELFNENKERNYINIGGIVHKSICGRFYTWWCCKLSSKMIKDLPSCNNKPWECGVSTPTPPAKEIAAPTNHLLKKEVE